MIKRRIAFRKKKQNRMGMFLVLVVLVMMMVVVTVKSIGLNQQIDIYTAKEESIKAEIAKEKKRTEEIEEYRKYTKTKKFAEEVAKDKLGLVNEGEIIFKEE